MHEEADPLEAKAEERGEEALLLAVQALVFVGVGELELLKKPLFGVLEERVPAARVVGLVVETRHDPRDLGVDRRRAEVFEHAHVLVALDHIVLPHVLVDGDRVLEPFV